MFYSPKVVVRARISVVDSLFLKQKTSNSVKCVRLER